MAWRRIARRRGAALVGTATLGALAALAACRADAAREPADATVTILDPNFEAIFNPSWSMTARFLVFSPLVGLDENGEIEPRLARRWEHSEDYREWTFHLRNDVRWHDGEPFTARDVAFTLRIMAHPDVAYRARLDTVIVADDSTVTVRWQRPHDALDDWWWVNYPEHLLGDVDPAEFFDAEFWTRPIGTGPFRYVRHVPRTVFDLEANPDYFRGRPAVDRVRIKFGGGNPLLELQSGNVDVSYVSRALVPRLREDSRFSVYHQVHASVLDLETFYWNHRHPALGDRAVRRAMARAIDRNELHRLLNLPGDLPIVDVPFTRRQFWARELPPPLPYDPARARALLDSAGWRDADGDGVRESDGRAAAFTALLGTGGSGATTARDVAAVYIQEALREVGIRMEIQRLESGVTQRIRSGAFEAAFDRFNRVEVPKRLWIQDSPLGYDDPELTRIFATLDHVLDPAARDELFRRSWPILQRDLPALFLAPQVQHFAAHRKLRGFSSPFQADPYIGLARVRVEAGS